MNHRVSELTGRALDKAVALAEGEDPTKVQSLRYSKSWRDAGRIIDRERIAIWSNDADFPGQPVFFAGLHPQGDEQSTSSVRIDALWMESGTTALEAAMRCYCRYKFGETVEIKT